MLLPEDATMSALLYIQLKHTSCHISTHTTYRSRRAEHLKQTIQSTAKQHNETISVIVIVVAVPDGSCCHRCCRLHHSLRHSRTAHYYRMDLLSRAVTAFSPGYRTGTTILGLKVPPLVPGHRAGAKEGPLVPVDVTNRD